MIKELFLYIIIYIVINIILVRIALHIFKNQNNQTCSFWSSIFSLILFIPLVYLFSEDKLLIILIAIMLESYIYFHILNIVYTSRRMKIISTIARNKNLDVQHLSQLFDDSNMVSIRLERLEKAGQITKNNQRYFIKKKLMLYIAKLLYTISIIFSVEWTVVRNMKREG